MLFLEFISAVFGWVYTLCWSASFYSQPLLNWRRLSTSGTTVDFPMINVFGFIAYLTSNMAFYYSPVIRAQYAARNHGLTPTVAFNDIVFAAHAVVLCAITTSQYFLPSLWGFERAPGTRPSRGITAVAAGSILAVCIIVFVVAGGDPGADARTSWVWLDAVYTISYVKLLVTLIKYAPQLLTNYRNRSTRGWSIWQILLDFSGGTLSIAQQGIDSWLQRDWSGITGNPVKFALGNVSMMYDVFFMTQHYVLYRDDNGSNEGDDKRDNDAIASERDSLLERGDAARDRRLD
ncbi:cystinosin [Apiospora saccharicola]|uniref:Cystinosin n=1 Tax=Apiospora saccharicola TaxID=335842 RepID=A0ABR1TJE6_9PEZI